MELANNKAAAGAAASGHFQYNSDVNHTPASFHYPAPHTVMGRFLGAMLRGDALTTLDALRRFGTTAATQVVQQLRHHGWPVTSTLIDVPTSDGGRRSRVARYSLARNTIAATGEAGHEFAAAALIAERERKGGM